jgi:predicted phosphodiesterase
MGISRLICGAVKLAVNGQSHEPRQVERNSVIYLNPGGVGPRSFRLPITVVRLDFTKQPCRLEFLDLAEETRRRE